MVELFDNLAIEHVLNTDHTLFYSHSNLSSILEILEKMVILDIPDLFCCFRNRILNVKSRRCHVYYYNVLYKLFARAGIDNYQQHTGPKDDRWIATVSEVE